MTVQDDAATQAATEAHGVTLTEAAASKARSLLDQEGRDDLALRGARAVERAAEVPPLPNTA